MAACGLASLNMLQQNPSGMVKANTDFSAILSYMINLSTLISLLVLLEGLSVAAEGDWSVGKEPWVTPQRCPALKSCSSDLSCLLLLSAALRRRVRSFF